MDEQRVLAEIHKSPMFKKYPAQNDKNDIRYKEFTVFLPYLAPAVDNTYYVAVPIPYFIYIYAEIYFTAVISGDKLIKELIEVKFILTISWDRPSGGKPTTFVVTATARNMHPYPPAAWGQIEDKNGKMRPAPKVMAEIMVAVERIPP